jgi:hypothetical protein
MIMALAADAGFPTFFPTFPGRFLQKRPGNESLDTLAGSTNPTPAYLASTHQAALWRLSIGSEKLKSKAQI